MIGDTTTTAISTAGTVGTSIAPLLTTAAWAVPVIGAATAALTIAWQVFRRRGQQKLAATAIIEKATATWQQNLDAYMNGPRTADDQAAALQLFDSVWTWVTSADGCGNPDLGAAGDRCISERQRGGIAPWCPTGSGCDAFITFRDPIANDIPQPRAVGPLGVPVSFTENPAGLLLPGLLIVGALML